MSHTDFIFKQASGQLNRLIEDALKEDLGDIGDLTTSSIVPERVAGKGRLLLKEDGVVCGLPVVQRVFNTIAPDVSCAFSVSDGELLSNQTFLGHVEGSMKSILIGERTALNFLQRLSGIATRTRQFVEAVNGTGAKITDTRKTTPCLRFLEKYAVRIGGGTNHRMGLYDMILIKDNHVDTCGGIKSSVEHCLSYLKRIKKRIPIEVETRTPQEVAEALELPVQRIMLDNMDLPTMRHCVELINGQIEVEASGNITLETVRGVAETGVDFISVGALTHSFKALDISLNVVADSDAG